MTRDGRISSAQLEALMPDIVAGLGEYPHDQFARYPARGERDGRAPWEAYLQTRLRRIAEDPEWALFAGAGGGAAPLLLGARTARWDLDQFGMAISSLAPLYCPNQDGRLHERTRALLDGCLAELKDGGVRFVSARVEGDQLGVIHALEEAGFRYYETTIWPVMATAGFTDEADPRVRLLADDEVDRAAQIAAEHGYPRTHFLCDRGFARERVEGMHAQWIRTAWGAGEPIAVIEAGDEIAGVFALRLDRELSEHLGWTYGRMRFLAVDSAYRGRGLGSALFRGAISLLTGEGAEYVDSGYPTKNHASARLHVQSAFRPVHQEATFHLWL